MADTDAHHNELPTPAGEPPAPIETSLTPEQVLAELASMSKRGKLAGFAAGDASGEGPLCSVTAFGNPFDRDLRIHAVPADGAGTVRLEFSFAWRKKFPAIFIAALVLSVWPGVHLTDSLLNTWFESYPNEFWITCAWYLPLTILPAPFAWRTAIRRSIASTTEHARETRDKIADSLASG